MLRKLIGYDFMSTWKPHTLILVLSTVSAVVGAVATIFSESVWVLQSVAALATMFATMAPLSVIILVAIHYHKKFFSDEAYLTFTLPATPAQHLASKMISGSIWTYAACLVLVVNMIIIEVAMLVQAPIIDDGVSEEVVVTGLDIAITVGAFLLIIIAVVAQLALIYLSLTISGNIATKHKGLVGIGVYMLVNTITSMILGIAEGIIVVMVGNMSGEMGIVALVYLNCALYIGLTIACIWINHNILSKKLNLA